ncbi:MAG: glyoxalase [Armatimonadetes bacterium]|nr:glyoxalase [Armatimonadota bacterium]
MKLKWDYVGVISADLKRSVEFYRLLGFPFPDPDSDHVEAELENGMRFALDSLELMKSLGPWEEPKGHRMGIAVNAETPAGVDETFKTIVDAGFEGMTEPFDAFWGQRYAQVKDPDGNPVDIYAPLE